MKRLLTACALAVLAVTLAAQTGSGVINGSVIDDAGGPVPGASVSLLTENGRLLKAVEADARGLFAFDALPDGRYLVTAAKLGYATRAFGQSTPSAGNVVIVVAGNGQYRARVRLPRLVALSGAVVDENSHPVSAEVRAQRFVMLGGLRLLDETTAAKTDADRSGRFRFRDLTPGEYVVSAIGPDGELRRMTPDIIQRAEQAVQQRTPLAAKDTGAESTVSYLPVYYPGVLNKARATAIPVVPGEERTDINLQLQVTPALRLQGTIVTADGKPAAYASVRLVTPDDGATWSYGQTTGTGLFQLAPVPAGSYTVVSGSTRQTVSLVDPSSSTVTIRTEPASAVLGRVQFEGSAPKPDCHKTPCTPLLRLHARTTLAPFVVDVRGVMDEAGPIVFSAVPAGTYTMSLGAPINGWRLVSAMLGGRDVADLPVEIGPSQSFSDLVVTFSSVNSELTGTAPVGGMSPTADAVSIVAFSTDRRFWFPGARRVRVARPDSTGSYRVDLPPGEYFVAVVANFDAESELDANRLAALAGTATRAVVRTPEPR